MQMGISLLFYNFDERAFDSLQLGGFQIKNRFVDRLLLLSIEIDKSFEWTLLYLR